MSQSFHRGRRLRWTPEIRSMVRETPPLLAEDLIMPYFVVETEDQSFRKEIGAMPGQYQLSLTELEKQVGPLARQSETAKKYLALREELKTCDVNLFLMESEENGKQLQEISKRESIVSGDLQDANAESEHLKEAYETLEREVAELDDQLTEKRNQMNQAEMLKGNLEGQINVLKEQINTEKMNAEHIRSRIESITHSLEEKQRQILQYQEDYAGITESESASRSSQEAAEAELMALDEKLMLMEQQLEEIDLFYSREGMPENVWVESGGINARTAYFLKNNAGVYNWITVTEPNGTKFRYEPGKKTFRESSDGEVKAVASQDGNHPAEITGKEISDQTGWYELYIEKNVPVGSEVYVLTFAMDLGALYEKIVAPVKIGEAGYSSVKDQNMNIIMHHVKNQIGLEAVDGRIERYPYLDMSSLNAWIMRQENENSGTGVIDTYVWDDPELKRVRRVVAFQAISIQGERWIVNSTDRIFYRHPFPQLHSPLRTA